MSSTSSGAAPVAEASRRARRSASRQRTSQRGHTAPPGEQRLHPAVGPLWSTTTPSRRKTTRSAQAACRASWVTSTPAAPASQRARSTRSTSSPVGGVQRAGRLVGEQQPARARPGPGRWRPAAAGRRTCRRGSGRPGRRRRPRRGRPARLAGPARRGRRRAPAAATTFSTAVSDGEQVEVLEDVADAAPADGGHLRRAQARRGRGPRRAPGRTSGCPARRRGAAGVDLPDPDGPMTATSSPAWTARSTPRSAWTDRVALHGARG